MKNKLFILVIITAGMVLFYIWDLGQYFTLEALKTNRNRLDNFYQTDATLMIAGFIILYMVIGLLMLPGSTFLSLCAGAIFGLPLGPLMVNVGSTLGATLAFLMARYVLRAWMEKKFEDKIKPINEGICENAIHCILFFRLIPIFPFFMVNITLGLTKVPLKTFILGTFFGTMPATWVYANAGSNLATINSFADITSPKVLGALTLLGILVIAPVIYKKINNRVS
jgi:uncharacterized membrane protein YdjX (TVP38/TMEM64 family)